MNKKFLKSVIFSFCVLLFFMWKSDFVKAEEYQIEVENVENLVYGNTLKSAKIVGNSEISGVFSFFNENEVLNDVGNYQIKIIFTPYDVENFQIKEIDYDAIVEKRRISIVFSTPLYKQYDGTNKISLPEYTFAGIIHNEVSLTGTLSGELLASYVSEDIEVELKGLTIEGEKKDCYYLETKGHKARIFPKILEKQGENATIITLANNVFVDINYSLKVEEKNSKDKIDRNYTEVKKYKYLIYDNKGQIIDVKEKSKIAMNLDKSLLEIHRLEIFELTSEGEYKELTYSYNNGIFSFEMTTTSTLVFVTRNIEYPLIITFGAILLFYFTFIMVYRFKNSKIKEY